MTVFEATGGKTPIPLTNRIEAQRLKLERKFPNAPIVLIMADLSPGKPATLIVSSNLDKLGLTKILAEAQRFSTSIIIPGKTLN